MTNQLKTLSLLSLCLLASGCASIDRMGAKVGAAINRVSSEGQLLHEGELLAINHFGSMTAIQLSGGKHFDVNRAPDGLHKGDVVRVYKTEEGLEARLWKPIKQEEVYWAPSSSSSSMFSH